MFLKLIKYLLYIGLLAGAGTAWLSYDLMQYAKQPILIDAEQSYTLQAGKTVKSLAKDLENHGIIANQLYFV